MYLYIANVIIYYGIVVLWYLQKSYATMGALNCPVMRIIKPDHAYQM